MENARSIEPGTGLAPGRIPPLSGADAVQMALAPFSDGRGKDPCFVMERKGQGGGLGAGIYRTPRPLAEFLRESVQDALGQAGFSLNSAGPGLRLSAELVELGFGTLVGFARCQVKSTAAASFTLARAGDGEKLWTARLSASGSAATGELITEALASAFSGLAESLVRDPDFTAAALAAGP